MVVSLFGHPQHVSPLIVVHEKTVNSCPLQWGQTQLGQLRKITVNQDYQQLRHT